MTTAENELVEKLAERIAIDKSYPRFSDLVEHELLPLIREYANALVGAACAASAAVCQGILEDRHPDDACGIAAANLCAMEVESLTSEASAKELEAVKLRARIEQTEKLIEAKCRGCMEAELGNLRADLADLSKQPVESKETRNG